MSYLSRLDQVPPDQPAGRAQLVGGWIRSEWRDFFAELRADRPILLIPGMALVTRYRDVIEVLSRHRDFSVRFYSGKIEPSVGPHMLGRDAPVFSWRDKSVMRLALPLDDLPRVRELAARLTDEALQQCSGETLDVVGTIGRHVPIRLCAEYFGFPGPDEATMARWSKAIQLEIFKNLGNDPTITASSVQSGTELAEYLKEHIAELRRAGSDPGTALGKLLRLDLPESLGFDDARLITNVSGLLVGAVETTSQAVAQVVDQILRRPDVQAVATAAARADDDAVLDPIVWEALRLDPINPLVPRFVERDAVVAAGSDRETVLPRGTLLFACTASAMHDERELDQPEVFRPGRPPHHYLHFGSGHHECLGVNVASVVVPEVVKRILLLPDLSRLPNDASFVDFGGGFFPERFEVSARMPGGSPLSPMVSHGTA